MKAHTQEDGVIPMSDKTREQHDKFYQECGLHANIIINAGITQREVELLLAAQSAASWQAAHEMYAPRWISGEDRLPEAGVEEFTWANFVSYLIDNCEGEAITEERLQHALSDMMAGVRYCPSMPTTHREAELKGVVVNNNLGGDQILLAHPPHTTIPIGTVMIACSHPDVSHDCCVVCGKNIMPNKPDFEWLAAKEQYSNPQPQKVDSCDCGDKSQCWEPCGELGHSKYHVKASNVVINETENVGNKQSCESKVSDKVLVTVEILREAMTASYLSNPDLHDRLSAIIDNPAGAEQK